MKPVNRNVSRPSSWTLVTSPCIAIPSSRGQFLRYLFDYPGGNRTPYLPEKVISAFGDILGRGREIVWPLSRSGRRIAYAATCRSGGRCNATLFD